MITHEKFSIIKNNYGYVASWAIWEKATTTPKSNIGDMDVLDEKINLDLLSNINQNVFLVGLNFSKDIKFEKPFMNFHDASTYANDFKIRYAFEETPYYGAYMTDLIKNTPTNSSKEVLSFLSDNPDFLAEQIESFINEINCVSDEPPIIFCFGKEVYSLIKKHIPAKLYSKLIQLIHYSHQISKEDYRKNTHEKIYKELSLIASPDAYASELQNLLNINCDMIKSLKQSLDIKHIDSILVALKKLEHSLNHLKNT